MRKFNQTFTWLLLCAFFSSCQKEVSKEESNNPGNNTGSNASYSWSFTQNNSAYRGCIDTAYYETANGIKIFNIEGSDSAGSFFSIHLVTLSGKLEAGTYSPAQGASMVFQHHNGDTYTSGTTASGISFRITAINDTSITATFTASLTDLFTNSGFAISAGSIHALIGKPNPCTSSVGGNTGGGSGGGTGGGSGSSGAEFEPVASGTACSNPLVQGNYNTGVDLATANTVSLEVNVTKTGNWSASTGIVNGIKFSGAGSFSGTGKQTIILQGSGKPVLAESSRFDVLLGNTECSFYVPVINGGTAPCSPDSNTARFSGVATINFYYVGYNPSASAWNGYTIDANGSGGDISLQFAGSAQPKPGIYHVKQVGGARAVDDVAVYAVAGSILWQSSTGDVYVTVKNGKVTAVLCDIPFSGSLGGPSYQTKITAKFTER